ncbi:MAG TPA: STAS domain-containing protein [Actinomycetota bacterium]
MAPWEITDRQDDHVVLRLLGRLTDPARTEELKTSLERHYVDDGVHEIRIDLAELQEISLEGVACLIELWAESRRRNKVFRIQGATGQVRAKLETTGTLQILEGPT